MFVLEGAPTIALGLLITIILPRTLQQAEFLSSAERRWLSARVDQSHKLQNEADAFSNRELMMDAARNYRVW